MSRNPLYALTKEIVDESLKPDEVVETLNAISVSPHSSLRHATSNPNSPLVSLDQSTSSPLGSEDQSTSSTLLSEDQSTSSSLFSVDPITAATMAWIGQLNEPIRRSRNESRRQREQLLHSSDDSSDDESYEKRMRRLEEKEKLIKEKLRQEHMETMDSRFESDDLLYSLDEDEVDCKYSEKNFGYQSRMYGKEDQNHRDIPFNEEEIEDSNNSLNNQVKSN
ncbi:hypothetical protein Anas_11793 [Armadillidium nasatum]|uniref:Uncharacterized protein n=1 Tax=Armadillidium nasatum TaxID=96803 RepID=A0A5N5T7Z0_9CRUS|nr:hypothetical protein Anas_11793 [Armadillidium nasatum]